MAADIETYMLLPYAVQVVPDATTDGGACYLASHPELPGCMAHGDSPDEALRNLEDARRLYLTTLIKRGLEVPKPHSATGAAPIHRQEISWTAQEPSFARPEPESPLKPVEAGT
jgi:predicted RNase H-like HicB family nuclease